MLPIFSSDCNFSEDQTLPLILSTVEFTMTAKLLLTQKPLHGVPYNRQYGCDAMSLPLMVTAVVVF